MPNYSSGLDRVFQALSDPTRRAIVYRLSRGPASVSEIAKPFAMAMPSLLQHLQVLEESRLIRSEKVGRVRTCRVLPGALDHAEAWIDGQHALWSARLDRMEAYVSELHAKRSRRRKHARKQPAR